MGEAFDVTGATCCVWREAPALNGCRTAAIGAFDCEDAAAGARLLTAVTARLADEGFGAALGPMDGDTWHRYRLVVESDGRPPFLTEPTNPPHFLDAFGTAGFVPVAHYVSAVDTVVAPESPVLDRQRRVRLRPYRPDDPDGELRRIHAVSLEAFSDNAFYQPLDFDGFRALYRPMLDRLDPELVLLAEDPSGRCVGFLFGLPDWLEGSRPRTVIVKTVASLVRGVGGLILEAFYRRVRARGFDAVIHALIHEDNLSLRQSAKRDGRVFRRYALWGREIGR